MALLVIVWRFLPRFKRCVCLFSFDTSLCAAAFNDATESVSDRTTYDRLFFYNGLMEDIKEANDGGSVSGRQMVDAFKDVSII